MGLPWWVCHLGGCRPGSEGCQCLLSEALVGSFGPAAKQAGPRMGMRWPRKLSQPQGCWSSLSQQHRLFPSLSSYIFWFLIESIKFFHWQRNKPHTFRKYKRKRRDQKNDSGRRSRGSRWQRKRKGTLWRKWEETVKLTLEVIRIGNFSTMRWPTANSWGGVCVQRSKRKHLEQKETKEESSIPFLTEPLRPQGEEQLSELGSRDNHAGGVAWDVL
jgi:hypothetical protein